MTEFVGLRIGTNKKYQTLCVAYKISVFFELESVIFLSFSSVPTVVSDQICFQVWGKKHSLIWSLKKLFVLEIINAAKGQFISKDFLNSLFRPKNQQYF